MTKNPRWKDLLLQSLSQSMKEDKNSINYCLSTMSRISEEKSSTREHYQPESRTVVHRGFVNERRKPEDSSTNPIDIGSSEGLIICTDIRSPKIDQLIHPDSTNEQIGTLASICWWLAPTGEQFRIKARAYLIPPPTTTTTKTKTNIKKINFPKLSNEINKKLSPSNSKQEGFNWEEERIRIFEKLSLDLKLTFLGPSNWKPGNKLIKEEDWRKSLSDDINDNDPILKSQALENFALVILDPFHVDLVRLKTTPHERFAWKKLDNDDWEETELIP